MSDSLGYQLVRLRDGACSVRSLAHSETMHPGLGPMAEPRALYVEQLRLAERVRAHAGEWVIWDVGLGAAANVLTVLHELRELPSQVHVVSFDHTLDPLRFAFRHRAQLGYFHGYELAVGRLLAQRHADFGNGDGAVRWDVRVTDLPSFLEQPEAEDVAKPHVVLFDPWSPARNPEMWTASLFRNLHRLLDPCRPCLMPTYSRSTFIRVSLLLAGFWVGTGRPAGRKEETTVAATRLEWIECPLDGRWLQRAERSRSAEPLWEPVHRQAPLAAATRERLRQHPQFQSQGTRPQ